MAILTTPFHPYHARPDLAGVGVWSTGSVDSRKYMTTDFLRHVASWMFSFQIPTLIWSWKILPSEGGWFLFTQNYLSHLTDFHSAYILTDLRLFILSDYIKYSSDFKLYHVSVSPTLMIPTTKWLFTFQPVHFLWNLMTWWLYDFILPSITSDIHLYGSVNVDFWNFSWMNDNVGSDWLRDERV